MAGRANGVPLRVSIFSRGDVPVGAPVQRARLSDVLPLPRPRGESTS
jgi:hypothetical protein